MTSESKAGADNSRPRGGIRGAHVLAIVVATVLVSVAVTYWAVRTYVYAKDFEPVVLSVAEQHSLDNKLRALGFEPEALPPTARAEPQAKESDGEWLRPERYSEAGARREVSFSERELNAMVAKNPDLARKLSVDLSDDLVSARLLVPVDPDFPILGGKTLRVSSGVELAFRESRPVVILRGVSVMGVPIPNAWLGGLKNIDLVSEFGDSRGFWKSFAEGVENIRAEEGLLRIKLKE